MKTETLTRNGDYSRLPQRIVRKNSRNLQDLAQGLRDFVSEGKVETWRAEKYNPHQKTTTPEGLKTQGMNEGEARLIIQEAERLELLSKVILEQLCL